MEEQELTLVEHLEELRKRIIYILVWFVIFFFIGFLFVKDIYDWLVWNIDVKLTILGPSDVMWIFVTLSGIVAIIATIPMLIFQIWIYVKPALTPRERKITLVYIPASVILFLSGLSFGYFVVFPTVFSFFVSLSGDMFTKMFTTEKYFRFMLQMTLPFSFLFEMPLLVMFLTSLGILTPEKLKKIRKYAYLVLAILSAVLTPPDFVSQTVVLVPLILLFETSVFITGYFSSRKKRRKRALVND